MITSYNPELLTQVPDTHEVFVYEGALPEIAAGWLYIGARRTHPAEPWRVEGVHPAAPWWGLRVEWPDRPYGRYFLLARPKQ